MNPYNFAMLLFAFVSFFLGLLIWLRRRDQLGFHYFIFSVFASTWATFWSLLISDNISYEGALTCSRFSHIVGGLTGVSWLHFCLVLVEDRDRHRKFVVLCYALSIVFSAFAFTPWFVPEVIPTAGFAHYTRTGIILDLYMILFFACVLLGFIKLIRGIFHFTGEKKLQIAGFLFATFIGFLGGLPTILPIYGVVFTQYNIFLIPIYPFVMFYVMIRQRLIDVEQITQAFQKEKLATIGLIAASINHEIKNPLYAAKGFLDNYVELTKEGLKNKDPIEVAERTRAQIRRALDVITKLNRFARPSADGIGDAGQETRANIQEALQNVLDLISYEFELDKIHIRNEIPNDLPQIQADQRQLEEILFNLIVNACYAMKGKGEGTLEIRSTIHASGPTGREVRRDSRITIEIQDTGTGIPPEQAKHLFEPFHTTKGDQGTGLGLYITKQLVEKNRGNISVKSQKDKGTTFLIEFQKAEAKI